MDGLPQYHAASQALSAALEPIENEVSAAGLFFPSVNPADPVGCVCDPNNFMHLLPGGCCVPQGPISCVVNALEESDQIAWTTGSAFRAALPAHAMPIQVGGTPLQTACEVSDAALGLRPVGAPTSVLLLTDGDPNCDTNNEQVVAYAQNWASQGVPTHVVGFASELMAADFLDRIASAGSTFTAHQVSDSAQLADALERVMQESVRSADVCTITLDRAAAHDLALIGELDGIDYRVLRGADTWSLAGDARHVTLAAELCASARGGALHSLRFVRGCADLPSWPLDLNDDAGL